MPHSRKSSARMSSRSTTVLIVNYRRSSIVWSRSTPAESALRVTKTCSNRDRGDLWNTEEPHCRKESVERVGIVDTSLNTWRRLLTFESNHHLPFIFVFS